MLKKINCFNSTSAKSERETAREREVDEAREDLLDLNFNHGEGAIEGGPEPNGHDEVRSLVSASWDL